MGFFFSYLPSIQADFEDSPADKMLLYCMFSYTAHIGSSSVMTGAYIWLYNINLILLN